MKKKSIIFLLFTVLIATVLCACKVENSFKPYTDYSGETFDLVIDDYVTVDGVLDEEIWTNNAGISIPGAQMIEGKQEMIDVSVYGERNATVYTYLGEKAIYFAFNVTDKNLYYNDADDQLTSHQTRVEFYFTNATNASISRETYYVGVNITGDEENGNVFIKKYQYNSFTHTFWERKNPMRVIASAKVDGKVMVDPNDTEYSTENNKGYVVEGAIDISFLGEKRDMMQFTAAFVQDKDFYGRRLNNTIIPGTAFLNVGTWKLTSNDGLIEDKTTFFDSQVQADEGVAIDGRLDDGIWENAVGRTVETTRHKNSNGENKKITSYVVTTEKGLYIGMDSNDEKVYYHDGMRAVYSTGAEILIATNKASVIKRGTSLQWRYNVGGMGNRYSGNEITPQDSQWLTGLPWKEEYFPGLCAGVVKCDSSENGMNSGKSDGWTGEVFIPWSSFPNETINYREQVAVMICPYSAYPLGTTISNGTQKYDYLAPVGVQVYGVGSQSINPQEKWFLFKDGKPLYDGLNVDDCYLDRMNLVSEQGVDYYVADVEAKIYDDVVTVDGFKEILEGVSGGKFDFGSVDVKVTDKGNGEYTLKIPASQASAFSSITEIPFVAQDKSASIEVLIDSAILLDGALDEEIWANLNKLETTQTSTFTTQTKFTVALRDGAMYIGAEVIDWNFAQYAQDSPIGLELYFNFGEKLSSKNTYQLRILANDTTGAKFYTYSDQPIGSDAFSWTGGSVNTSIKHVFRAVSSGYEMEAKIPYSLFGLDGKPESVEIAVLTKFIKSTSNKTTATRFFNCEGNNWSREQSIYLNFDETGFAPNKVYMQDESGNKIDAINLLQNASVVGDRYQGTIKLAVTKGNMTITDASFGAYDQYFDKSNSSNGEYTFSIPISLFSDLDELLIAVKSATYSLDANIAVNRGE